MTGTKSGRPELNRLIDDLETGDTVIIADLARISRSTQWIETIGDKSGYGLNL